MSIPLHQLPPLDMLRAFVAVGRRMSITVAAQDLHRTQGAVSRQVQALETQLGVRLLHRGHRAIDFTPEGARLFATADAVLRQLQDTVAAIGTRHAPRAVTLSASIGVTGLWLLPRLNRLQAAHPGVDLRVSAHNALADLRRDGIDLAIRYTTEAQAPRGALRLFGETIAPVAHPALAARVLGGEARLRRGQSLAGIDLLELDEEAHPFLHWAPWLARAGWTRAPRARSMLHFNQYDQVIQAALAGQGVALGRLELVRALIDGGQLAVLGAPVPPERTAHAYWLLQAVPEPRLAVRKVIGWIADEARATALDL